MLFYAKNDIVPRSGLSYHSRTYDSAGVTEFGEWVFPERKGGSFESDSRRRRGVAVYQFLISIEIFLEIARRIQADNRSPLSNPGGAPQTAFHRPQKEAPNAAWRRSPPQVCAATALASLFWRSIQVLKPWKLAYPPTGLAFGWVPAWEGRSQAKSSDVPTQHSFRVGRDPGVIGRGDRGPHLRLAAHVVCKILRP